MPPEATWLQGLSEAHLMRDVDRYVDQLYSDHLKDLKVPFIKADCHRYVIDLNRLPGDFDAQAVDGAINPQGTHPKGLHWCLTTFGEPLIVKPMTQALHDLFVSKHYEPFHSQVKDMFLKLGVVKATSALTNPAKVPRPVYHLDAHSMPSRGTAAHNDPGEERADVVVSDFHGKSCCAEFKDIVIKAYADQGFKVAYNWPYFGGGITQMYGRPEENHHTLQVELNRKTYMNEDTKKMNDEFAATKEKIARALAQIVENLKKLKA